MRVGSLFSGIGGMDLGLERVGMEVRWQCEIDTAAQSVLRRRFPDATLYDDVRTIGADVERVDLICGGFPCQDLSVAGRRAGLAGGRSGLFYEFMRIAGELAPRWVLIENVPGLLSSQSGRDMGAVLGTLGELGYGWAYRVLDAQYLGVAQRRRRVFIVGCLGDSARAAKVLFEPESCDGDTAPRRKAGTGTARELAACLNSGGNDGGFRTEPREHLVAFQEQAYGAYVDDDLASTLAVSDHKRPTDLITHALTAEGHDASEDGTGRGVPLMVAKLTSNGDQHTGFRSGDGLVAYRKAQKPHDADDCERWEEAQQVDTLSTHGTVTSSCVAFSAGNSADAYGIALTEEGMPPLKAADSGLNQVPTVQYGMAVRRLTPTECERLQGFPDGWTDGQSDSARYRQLGNAVCVPVAHWIGKRIMEAAK